MSDERTSDPVNKVCATSKPSSGSTCTIPGWCLSDYTRTGKLGVWNISRMMDSEYLLPPLVPESSHASILASMAVVVNAQKTVVSRNLYQLTAIHQPMLYIQKIGYIGRTSFTTVTELRHKETGACLVRAERQLIYIDKKTRTAQPLPQIMDEMKEQYPRYDFVVKINPKPTDPKKVFIATFKVAASDMDINYHTNQSVYYRFSLDAAYEAWKDGFLRKFSADPCEYEVKSYEGKHVMESFPGDIISVAVWEDDSDKLTLQFEIRKAVYDAYVMFARVAFFALDSAKL